MSQAHFTNCYLWSMFMREYFEKFSSNGYGCGYNSPLDGSDFWVHQLSDPCWIVLIREHDVTLLSESFGKYEPQALYFMWNGSELRSHLHFQHVMPISDICTWCDLFWNCIECFVCSSKHQIILWGAVFGVVGLVAFIWVCYRKDTYMCEGDTLGKRMARCCGWVHWYIFSIYVLVNDWHYVRHLHVDVVLIAIIIHWSHWIRRFDTFNPSSDSSFYFVLNSECCPLLCFSVNYFFRNMLLMFNVLSII